MDKKIPLNEWIDMFNDGAFETNDFKTQVLAGWFDWFCRDNFLSNKTKKMGNIIKQIKSGGKVDLTKWYVWFKNNCPLNGPLYDDFRFADLETGEVQLTIQISCCWNEHRFTVWGRRCPGGEFQNDTPLFECDKIRELVKWLNNPWDNDN